MGRRENVGAVSCGFDNEIKQQDPDINCPALPHREVNNFWSSSCTIKQTMPEHHKTCYPRCKMVTEGQGESKPETSAKHQEMRDEALKVRTEIIKLHGRGVDRADIAEITGKNINYVFRCLRENGFTGRRKDSLRQKILGWLEDNPGASYHQVQEEFCCARSTAEKYRSEFNQGKRAVEFD